MPRYFTQARKVSGGEYWSEPAPLMTSLEVSDHEAVYTGLLDSEGNAIMRAPNPMGFGKDDEW